MVTLDEQEPSRKNSSKLIELSSVNKVSLVQLCYNILLSCSFHTFQRYQLGIVKQQHFLIPRRKFHPKFEGCKDVMK